MFFLHELEHTVPLHPSYFDQKTYEYVENALYTDVEGTNTGSYYILCVVNIIDISEPRVLPGSATAEFKISYTAIVWRPFKGEVCDGEVANVTPSGFFVDVGPLQVFVSKAMIPEDMKYDGNATPPQFTDNVIPIERGTQVRVKIRGVRAEVGRMFAVATIKEDYLGALTDD
ncbi:DNA-directed RNA polymerase II subunit rpb7 [Sphaceloma murrayae]|uniref:DNA-directed RNA polymerase subunit n=1 Tax=Sphaceloma murrayae TaxID=2082308 RepID=A0A2K1QU57_9PEZI|nr:DNA-directed RNA polymerase II subunit rpb7 [Sphaceloma murrayae]